MMVVRLRSDRARLVRMAKDCKDRHDLWAPVVLKQRKIATC